MSFSKGFSLLLFLQIGHHCAARSETTCLTRRKCDMQRRNLDFSKFYIGNYSIKGCFFKGDVAYFGTGGNRDDRSTFPLSGGNQRIWCNDNQIQSSNAKEPTEIPTKAPTKPLETAANNLGDECTEIQVKVNTGKLFGRQAGFVLSPKSKDGTPSENLLDFPVGSLESERKYSLGPECVPDGTYNLTVVGKSTYAVVVGGEEVLFGSTLWEGTSSHEIIIGYEHAMDDAEKAWLDEHNARREEFHKNHDKEYRPLTWSPELAKAASNWVDKILPTCQFVRDPDLLAGENVAMNNYIGSKGPSNDEIPAKILARWSDRKLGKGYPDIQTMTQVMWRGTRYLGCATKSMLNDDGAYCHVSICRYSRPGNCNMRSENWLDVTLDDHSRCGDACPKEGCH